MEEAKLISIATYINPHAFWITFNKDQIKLLELEETLQKQEQFKQFHILEGLAIIKDNKTWKRAVIKQYDEETNKYKCWLIDYGSISYTEKVYCLPQEFMSQPPFAQPACLHNVIPLKNILDVEKGKCVYEKQVSFSPGTIKVVSDYIQKADLLAFHVKKVIKNVLCGVLYLQIKGSTINLIDTLVEKKHIALDMELFLQATNINFSIINENSINIGMTNEKHSLMRSEGMGRGCLRKNQVNTPPPGINTPATYTPKWLMQKTKTGDTVRPLSRRSNNSEKFESCSETTSQKETVKVLETENNAVVQTEVKSSKCKVKIPPSLIKKANSNLEVNRSHNTSVDSNDNEKYEDRTSPSISSDMNLSLLKKRVGENQCIKDEGVRKTITPSDIIKIIKARVKSKGIVSKVETYESSKEDESSWDNESDNNSQDTTDYIFDKSLTEDSTSDQFSKLINDSSNPEREKSSNKVLDDVSERTKMQPPASNSSDSDIEMPKVSLRKKMKIGCQCENCLKWEENDFAEKEETFTKVERKEKLNLQPPLLYKDESAPSLDIEMKKIERSQTKIEKDIAPCLLVHSLQFPRYVTGVVDVAFSDSVHKALNNLKLTNVYTIQSYAWPAIMRAMNVCLVGSPQSGKSISYIPGICTFIIEKHSRYFELPKEHGPIAIILCESTFKAEETYNLFITILKQTHMKVSIMFAIPPIENNYLKCIRSCDILITTPRVLVRLLKSRIINLKRLCHFVMEDADKLFTKFQNEVNSLTMGIESMLKHRVCFYGVQVITVSEQWTRNLETFLKKLNNTPIICITSYLQCAIYSRANIQMHFVPLSAKNRRICDFVKDNSRASKTVIMCNEDTEVLAIAKLLQIEGVSVVTVTLNMMADEIFEQEQTWNSANPGRYSVLICTDVTLNTQLNVTQAEILIHYALPKQHWSDFSRRFKCLLDNYDCPLNSKFQPGGSCRIHVYVNEDCSRQYPRLCRFLTDMGTSLPQKFIDISTDIAKNEEQIKIENNIPLCKKMKLLGHCNKFRCNKRHKLSSDLDLLGWVPTAGRIKLKLLNVIDATTFGAILVEHMDTNRNINKITDHTEFLTTDLTQAIRNNKISAIHVSVGKLYAWFDEEADIYRRCKVLRILNEFKITKAPSEVIIRLLDIGKEKRVQTGDLFKLPEIYANLPPQSVDVYLANILPLDEDEHYSARIKNKVTNIISSVNYSKDNSYFVGRIVLQIGESLWLDDMKLQENLEYSHEIVTTLPLRKKLLDLQLGCENEQQLNGLYKLCHNCGIELPSYEVKPPVVNALKPPKQLQPQWSYLDEGYNIVYFCSADSPNKFYVRHQKFNNLFEKLQRDIKETAQKPFYNNVKEILIGNCYLAKDPEGEEYGRVIVREINDDMVNCFFVDFGDSTTVLKEELKLLPAELINRLPFQAIECTLFGVQPILDCWAYESTNVFYDHCFVKGTDVYKNLYVQYLKSTRPVEDQDRYIYSVTLLDYVSDKPIFINNTLINCGFASTVENEPLTNLSLPDRKDEIEEVDVDSDSENEIIHQPVSSDSEDDSSIPDEDNVWEIRINNKMAVFEDIFGKREKQDQYHCRSGSTGSTINLKPMVALPSVNYCTPDVVWYQTNSLVKFDIMLPGVEKYFVNILKKSIFSFSTVKSGKEYKLNFQLFDTVNSTFQHNGGGPVVRVTLTKIKAIEWDRLTFSEQKMRNIKYDMSKSVFPEERKRRFLEIEKDEQEEADNNDIIVEIGSDEDYSESDIETDVETD